MKAAVKAALTKDPVLVSVRDTISHRGWRAVEAALADAWNKGVIAGQNDEHWAEGYAGGEPLPDNPYKPDPEETPDV